MLNETTFRHWDEAVGKFLGLEKDDNWIIVRMSCGDLLFHADSVEAQILSWGLEGLTGKRIGVLRTGLPERPVAVRVLKEGGRRKWLEVPP
jgi:hypothetical protein